MPRTAARLVFLTFALAGCSAIERNREEPDTTPQNLTAVLEVKVVNNGIKGLVPFEGTTKTWTREGMQREETTVKGTGTITRFIVGTTETSRIERLDRKLVWRLNAKEKTYTECPLRGCAGPVAAEKPQEKKPQEPKKAEEKRDAECKLKIASSNFTVKKTGETKTINGFNAEQYQAAWLVTLADPAARKTLSSLVVNVWTTQATQPLKDAMAVETAYAKEFAAALVGTASGAPKTKVLPDDAQRMIEGYMAQMLTPADRAGFLKAGRDLEKIKGYPVLTQLTWNLTGDACAAKEEASGSASASSSSSSVPSSVSGAVSSVAGWFAKKKTDEAGKEIADAAILSFATEVKFNRIEMVHDSLFSPPKGYALAKTN
jgi:hypothetical protein